MKYLKTLLLLGIAIFALSACVSSGNNSSAKDKGATMGQYASDSLITSKVKAKFLADIHLKSYNISISTNNGVVTLTGTVPNQEMRKLAIENVQNTDGVKAVNVTNFKVMP